MCAAGTFAAAASSACMQCSAGTYLSGSGWSPLLQTSVPTASAPNGYKQTPGVGQYCSQYMDAIPTIVKCPSMISVPIYDYYYICNPQFPYIIYCTWNYGSGCYFISNKQNDPTCHYGDATTTWSCDAGCNQLAPCTNGLNAVFTGPSADPRGTSSICPVACYVGYSITNQSTGLCTCTSPPCQVQGASPCLSCPAGKYSTAVGAISSATCSACPNGTFSSVTTGGASSSAACSVCLPGSYTTAAGTSSCIACAAGTYSTSSGATAGCTALCPAGFFAAAASGASSCMACAAGTYSTGQGALPQVLPPSVAAVIAAGGVPDNGMIQTPVLGQYCNQYYSSSNLLYWTTGFNPASPLDPQSDYLMVCYAPLLGQAHPLCPWARNYGCYFVSNSYDMNTYIQTTYWGCVTGCVSVAPCANSANALLTTVGPISSSSSSMCPVICYIGYTMVNGSCVCQSPPCLIQGASPCQGCSAGTYSTALGAVSSAVCTSCPAGTYTSSASAAAALAACNACPSGTFSTAAGATSSATCSLCTAGTFYGGGGVVVVASSCVQCSAGAYASGFGASTCLQCQAGTFMSSSGATFCQQCAANWYNQYLGQIACLQCTNGLRSNPGQAVCSAPTGMYVANGAAQQCPAGYYCPN